MAVTITLERADSPEASVLVEELDAYLSALYPPESNHGLSIAELLDEAVSFFLLRQDGVAAGCGAVKFHRPDYAEVKRMFILPAFRGNGFAKAMLAHLQSHVAGQGIPLLRLETGIYQAEAIRLYERFGFQEIPPFGDYRPDPLSVFYEKRVGEQGKEETE